MKVGHKLLLLPLLLFCQSFYADVQSTSESLKKALEKYGTTIRLEDVAGTLLTKVSPYLPKKVEEFLSTVQLRDAYVTDQIEGFKKGTMLAGVAEFGSFKVSLYFVTAQLEGKIVQFIQFYPGDDFKMSAISSDLTSLDKIKFAKLRFIIPFSGYKDPMTGLNVKSVSLNVITSISLGDTAFESIRKFVAGMNPAFIASGAQLNAQLVIPLNPLDTKILLLMPVRLGIDFEELYKQGKMKTPPSVVKSFTTDDLNLEFSPFKLAAAGGAGLIVNLVTQDSPLTFRCEVGVKPTAASISGVMRGMYERAFGISWLNLGNFAVQFDFDFKMMAALAMPFTGFGVRGEMKLGRTTVQLFAKVELGKEAQLTTETVDLDKLEGIQEGWAVGQEDEKTKEINFEGDLEALDIEVPQPESMKIGEGWTSVEETFETTKDDFVKVFEEPSYSQEEIDQVLPVKDDTLEEDWAEIVEKKDEKGKTIFKKVPRVGLYGKIDKIDFTDIFAEFRRIMSFNKKEVSWNDSPPIRFTDLEVRFMPQSMNVGGVSYGKGYRFQGAMEIGKLKGYMLLQINTSEWEFIAKGWLSPIDTSFFKLTGAGFDRQYGTADDGATVDISMHLKTLPPKLPKAYISAIIELPWLGVKRSIEANLSSKGLFLETSSVAMFGTKAKTFILSVPFNSFEDLLVRYEMDKNTMQILKEKVISELDKWYKSIGFFKEALVADVQKEIEEKRMKINKLRNERNYLEAECKRKTEGGIKKIFSKDYWSGVKDCIYAVGKELEREAGTISKEITHLEKKLYDATVDVTMGTIKGVKFIIDVATAFEITKIVGEMTGRDLKDKKAPRVRVEMTVNVAGKVKVHEMDVQFDFKDPSGSAKAIAEAIKGFFK